MDRSNGRTGYTKVAPEDLARCVAGLASKRVARGALVEGRRAAALGPAGL